MNSDFDSEEDEEAEMVVFSNGDDDEETLIKVKVQVKQFLRPT